MGVLEIFKKMMYMTIIWNPVGESGQDSNMMISGLQVLKNETPKFRSGTPDPTLLNAGQLIGHLTHRM